MKTVKTHLAQGHIASLAFALVVVVLAWASSLSASAQETWTGATSGTWSLSTNWSGGIPAATDTATFNNNVNTAINLTATTGVGSITFDTANAGAFTIGTTSTGTLALAAAGTVQMTSSVVNSETFTAPITLASNYSFINNSTSTGATLNISGTIRDLATGVIILGGTNTGANTISGVISGAATTSVTKNGPGTWILSGANTFTGGLTINGGILQANGNTTGVLASGKTVALNGGTFDYNSSNSSANTQTLGNIAVNTGANVIQNDETSTGSSTLTIGTITRAVGATVNLVTTGGAVINSTPAITGVNTGIFLNGADFVQATAGGQVTAATYTSVPSGTTAFVGAAGAYYLFNGNVTGSSNSTTGIKTATTGTWTMTGNPNNLGGILVTGGVTYTTAGAAFRGNSGNGEINLRTDTVNDKLIVNDIISASNVNNGTAVVKSGAGTLILSGSNTFFGNLYVNEGTVRSTNAQGLGYDSGSGSNGSNLSNSLGTTTVQTGATLDLVGSSGNMTVNEPIILNGGALTNSGSGVTTLDNGIAGLTVQNLGAGTGTGGTVTIANTGSVAATATFTITGTNGALSTLYVTNPGSGFTSAPLVTFNVTGGTETTPPVATAILSSVTLTGTTNTIGGSGGFVINSVIGGTGSFGKTGTGTLVLSGANTYTGGTHVTGGTIQVTNTSGSGTGTGAFALDSGTTLAGTGSVNSTTNTINGAVQAGFSGTSTATTGNLTLTSSAATTFGSTANLAFNIDAATAGQGTQLNVSGSNLVFPGAGMTLTVNLINSNTSAIASPTSYILFAGTSSSQYTGLTTDGNGHITNLILSLTGTMADGSLASAYYNQSYLFLGGAGNGDLEVMVVPEPGTWVLMLGGLVLLLGYQRARRSNN